MLVLDMIYVDWIVKKKKKIYRYFEMSFSCFGPFGVWGVTKHVQIHQSTRYSRLKISLVGFFFFSTELGHHPCYAWRSILAAQDVVEHCHQWIVGNRQLIDIWNDKWLHQPCTFKLTSRPVAIPLMQEWHCLLIHILKLGGQTRHVNSTHQMMLLRLVKFGLYLVSRLTTKVVFSMSQETFFGI